MKKNLQINVACDAKYEEKFQAGNEEVQLFQIMKEGAWRFQVMNDIESLVVPGWDGGISVATCWDEGSSKAPDFYGGNFVALGS